MTHLVSFFWWCLTKKKLRKAGHQNTPYMIWGICKNPNSHSQKKILNENLKVQIFTGEHASYDTPTLLSFSAKTSISGNVNTLMASNCLFFKIINNWDDNTVSRGFFPAWFLTSA